MSLHLNHIHWLVYARSATDPVQALVCRLLRSQPGSGLAQQRRESVGRAHPHPLASGATAYCGAHRREWASGLLRTALAVPMTNPSRWRSKGREASWGLSLKPVDSARMRAKPATPSGLTDASVPPAIIRSASPWRMRRKASATAWAPLAHAVETAVLGPFSWCRMATLPAAGGAGRCGWALGRHCPVGERALPSGRASTPRGVAAARYRRPD
jgi:hypothetical protein